MNIIAGGKIFINHRFEEGYAVVFDCDILKIVKLEELGACEYHDLKGAYLVPGFIDVHVHGCNGSDTMDASPSALDNISRSLVKHGVTSFLPTTMTNPLPTIRSALENIRRCPKPSGAKILGVHLEGPFLNPKYSGAQPVADMIDPERRLIEEFQDIIKVVTIAPETAGALEMIRDFGEHICFSLGHSDSDYETAVQAFEAGARSVTHLFNAMSPLHHRKPGLVGASLCSESTFAEIICDDIHIHPELYRLVLKAKGSDKVMLVTDCIRAGGLSDGTYELGGQPVHVCCGKCTLENGTIAGSILSLDKALKNMVRHTGISPEAAIPMISYNQALYLGMEKKIGSIAVGAAADFVILSRNLDVLQTYVDGKLVHSSL
ncbi:MAG: N-acetylglucosamine-6-phosphate deacetylase [Bacillota bacterium]|nr:N-acetylglucosamine-6-phosphate deacetylase [Bacillota bacterium]